MSRSLSTANAARVQDTLTRPIFIANIGFGTALRISSRGTITYDGASYTGVSGMQVSVSSDGLTGQVRWYNHDFVYSPTFANNATAGVTITIRAAWGNGPFSTGDWDTIFVGELGGAKIDRFVTIDLLPQSTRFTPRQYIEAPTFSHIPPDGTQIFTAAGTVILNRT